MRSLLLPHSSMIQNPFLYTLGYLKSLQHPNGGFPYLPGEEARPDATAWAIISMSAYSYDREGCARGRMYLVSQQGSDGRVSISLSHPDASWPTPLALIAWQGFSQFQESQSRAIDYLLGLTGGHFPNPDHSIIGHDTSIKGWPWITQTHSWVIPTAMTIVALQMAGITYHERISEGISMLLDRQLSPVGWNSGNTTVFGKALLPLPECTGIALDALSRNIKHDLIANSLTYLWEQLENLRTPLSLGWTLLGLSAWGLKPPHTEELILACLQRQERYGSYPIPSLALLLCAMKAPLGLHSLFKISSHGTTTTSLLH